MEITKKIIILLAIANLVFGFLYLRERYRSNKYRNTYQNTSNAMLKCRLHSVDSVIVIDVKCLYMNTR